jgi:replicative DNA helicase
MTASLRRDAIESHIVGPTAPAAVEAEKALIGIVLADPAVLESIDPPPASDLYTPLHGRLWSAVLDHHARGVFPDTALLDGQFVQDEAYRQEGGITWLANLRDVAPGASKAGTYAAAIRETAARRAIMRLAKEVGEKAQDHEAGPAADLLAELERGAAEIAKTADIADAWLKPAEMIGAAVERARARKGVIDYPLGIPDVDRLLGGLHRAEVTLLAARPGMGKTVGALAYAKAVARSRRLALFFSLEMGEDPMALRLACDMVYDRDAPYYLGQTSNITSERIDRDELSAAEWQRIDEARREVARWPLRFDTRAGHTMARIEALARRAFQKARRAGIEPGAVIIDHLGKVRPGKDRRGNMHAEMADKSADAADMAKRLEVPVLALVQLNRGVEGRDDKRPMLSDLRQAGELEEDARQVVFLYRPEYYLRPPADTESFEAKVEREAKLDQARNKLFWIVEKNSHGPRGQALTFCDIAASAVREWRP